MNVCWLNAKVGKSPIERPKIKYMDVVKVDMKLVGMREEDVDGDSDL